MPLVILWHVCNQILRFATRRHTVIATHPLPYAQCMYRHATDIRHREKNDNYCLHKYRQLQCYQT